jgi:hypothetical protein
MIYAIFLLMPLGLGALSLLGGITAGLVFAISLAWLLAVVALAIRRFAPAAVSAIVLLLAFLAQIFVSPPPQLFWPAVGFGIGLLAMLELGHDCTSISHGKLTVRAYALRARSIGLIAAADLVAVFVIATVAYNVAVRFPGLPFAVFLIPALLVVIPGVTVVILIRVRVV